jgi:hypothetical protein
MTDYLIVNRHTDEVYARISAANPRAIKTEWARMCGVESWEEFIGKTSINEDDFKIYESFGEESTSQPPEICSMAENDDGSFFFVIRFEGAMRAFWFDEVNGNAKLRTYDSGEEGDYIVAKRAYRTWDSIPKSIQEAMITKIKKLA